MQLLHLVHQAIGCVLYLLLEFLCPLAGCIEFPLPLLDQLLPLLARGLQLVFRQMPQPLDLRLILPNLQLEILQLAEYRLKPLILC